MSKLLGMCLDWRVLGGLAVVGLGIWLYAPQLIGAALPLLVLLACPLSMAVMAWMMRGSMRTQDTSLLPTARLAALEQQQARLNSEIGRVRAELATPSLPTQTQSAERSEA